MGDTSFCFGGSSEPGAQQVKPSVFYEEQLRGFDLYKKPVKSNVGSAQRLDRLMRGILPPLTIQILFFHAVKFFAAVGGTQS